MGEGNKRRIQNLNRDTREIGRIFGIGDHSCLLTKSISIMKREEATKSTDVVEENTWDVFLFFEGVEARRRKWRRWRTQKRRLNTMCLFVS